MTISSSVRRAGPYDGNGSNTTFVFGFKVFEQSDVRVTHTDTSEFEAELTLGVDYTVSLNPDQESAPGGTVTYPVSGAPLDAGEKLTLTGALPYQQPTAITNLGGFYPRVIEDALDRNTIQIQQVAEEVSRAIKAQVSGTGDPQEIINDLISDADDARAAAQAAASSAQDAEEAEQKVAPHYDAIDKIGDNIDDVHKVAAIDEDVQKVAAIDSDVSKVAGIDQDVATVAGIKQGIQTVNANADDISKVAAIDDDITKVADIDEDVTAVRGNQTDISRVASIQQDVTKVADIDQDVSEVADISEDVTTVAQRSTNLESIDDDVVSSLTTWSSKKIRDAATRVVDDYAALKALTGMEDGGGASVERRGDSPLGGGRFVWRDADNSAEVAADPQEGLWVAPDFDATGASGAWKRIHNGVFEAAWFGAAFDGQKDDWAALQAAVNAAAGQGVLRLSAGTAMLSAEIKLPSHSRVEGRGKSVTTLKFLDDVVSGNILTNEQNTGDDNNAGNEHIYISDLTTDGNFEVRRGNVTVERPRSSDGCGIALCGVRYAEVKRVHCTDNRLHGIDVAAAYYLRAKGIPNSEVLYVHQPSKHILLENCEASRAFDDCITTHYSDDITIINPYAHDAYGSLLDASAQNSNAIEIDEGSRDVLILGGKSWNSDKGIQVKGHDDTVAATRVRIIGHTAYNNNVNFEVKQDDVFYSESPADPNFSLSSFGVQFIGCTSIQPIAAGIPGTWAANSLADLRAPRYFAAGGTSGLLVDGLTCLGDDATTIAEYKLGLSKQNQTTSNAIYVQGGCYGASFRNITFDHVIADNGLLTFDEAVTANVDTVFAFECDGHVVRHITTNDAVFIRNIQAYRSGSENDQFFGEPASVIRLHKNKPVGSGQFVVEGVVNWGGYKYTIQYQDGYAHETEPQRLVSVPTDFNPAPSIRGDSLETFIRGALTNYGLKENNLASANNFDDWNDLGKGSNESVVFGYGNGAANGPTPDIYAGISLQTTGDCSQQIALRHATGTTMMWIRTSSGARNFSPWVRVAVREGAESRIGITSMAIASNNNVSSYAFLTKKDSAAKSAGDTVAGSNLRYSSADADEKGTPSGTWRCMGNAVTGTTGTGATTLWTRIS